MRVLRALHTHTQAARIQCWTRQAHQRVQNLHLLVSDGVNDVLQRARTLRHLQRLRRQVL
jgi:hypothetical protein